MVIDWLMALDILKHIALSLSGFSFVVMTIKETIDVFNGYIEYHDWFGNVVGLFFSLNARYFFSFFKS